MALWDCSYLNGIVTLPMLWLLFSKAQAHKDFWKPSKPCHVGIHLKALAEYSHMSTHLPGFQPFFRILHNFVLAKVATSSIRVNLCAAGGYWDQNKMMQKNIKNDWNPGTWVLIWENSTRAIQWIPTWQGLDGFQKPLHPCALDEISLSIGRQNNLFSPLQTPYS